MDTMMGLSLWTISLFVHVEFELEHVVSDEAQEEEEAEQDHNIHPVHLEIQIINIFFKLCLRGEEVRRVKKWLS